MNEDARENLDTWERRDHELIRDHLNEAPVRFWRTIAESWEWINLKWWTPDNQTEKTLELLRMGEKNCLNWKQLWEDDNKLESWIIERMDKIEREEIFFGLQMLRMTTRNTTKNYWGTPEWRMERLSQRWKEFERSWRNTYDWWWIILTSNLEKNYRITPERLEELGKILGKDPWVRAHSRETPLNDLK